VLNQLPLPVSFAVIQLFLGIPLFMPIWMVKPPKDISKISLTSISLVAGFHGLGNLATIYSLGSGSVSFTHVVKSAEPLFTAFLSICITKSVLSTSVYLSLIPIVVGVALASAKEVSFSWFGFLTAMASNLLYQLRIVLSKQLMAPSEISPKISAPNIFRLITLVSFFELLPLAIIIEGDLLFQKLHELWSLNSDRNNLLMHILVSGFSYYMYNEIAFWILDLVHPLTHAVGNTVKRVVLIIVSIVVFQYPISILGAFGSTMAVMGSFLYVYLQERDSRS